MYIYYHIYYSSLSLSILCLYAAGRGTVHNSIVVTLSEVNWHDALFALPGIC